MSRLAPETHFVPSAGTRASAPPGLRAVVIGGGIAGVAAATLLCERGVQVTLLEREQALGGRAGAFPITLASGERVEMERGFHGFFRQYYTLRALLRRIDPALSMLRPLLDYPVLGPNGTLQTFAGLPKRAPFSVLALTLRTPHLRMRDLVRVAGTRALQMLAYDAEHTYARFDHISAAAYLDSLHFPETARRMLFDVFSHSFFNPESEMSAAELLMMFHFYFTGNPEGLVFDVTCEPLSFAIWQPFAAWLLRRGVELRTAVPAERVVRSPSGTFVVEHAQGTTEAELLVLALDVAGLQGLIARSPGLAALRPGLAGLQTTLPFAVMRLWLDRPLAPERAPFAGTTGVGQLDNVSLYERFQGQSAAWAATHGGSVVELHAYAVPHGLEQDALRADLIAGLHAFYPEARGARVLDAHFSLRADCPAFPPGGFASRPRVVTALPDVALAGDFVRVPWPSALMERAAMSGMLAANHLLARFGVRPEPIVSVPRHGLFAPLRTPNERTARDEPRLAPAP